MTQFILLIAFNQWSKNCDFFKFKHSRMPCNLIKQNLRVCGRTDNWFKEDSSILVLYNYHKSKTRNIHI